MTINIPGWRISVTDWNFVGDEWQRSFFAQSRTAFTPVSRTYRGLKDDVAFEQYVRNEVAALGTPPSASTGD